MRVVLGCMTFGESGGGARVKTDADAQEIIDLFKAYNHSELDTARIYCDGNTEKMMGRLSLDGLTIDTKCFPIQLGGLQPQILKTSLETSLAALGKEKCNIFYLHAPDYATPIADTLKAVNELYQQGKFTYFGLSNYPAWTVTQIYYICKMNNYVLPTFYQGMYNAFTRNIESELFAVLEEFGIAFRAYNPLCGGVLAGALSYQSKVEEGSRFDPRTSQGARYRERYWHEEYFKATELLQKVCSPHGLTLVDVAFRWLQFHSKMNAARGDGIIIGASTLKHTRENLDALKSGVPLPQDVLNALEECRVITQIAAPAYFRSKDQMTTKR